MLVCCKKHARAICRISISELRRVAPSAFAFLMVVSILLADGLFPVYASRYRTPASLYVSSNVASRTNGVGNNDGVLSSRRGSVNNIRYRTKAKVKPPVSKREDSVMNGGMDSANSNLQRSRLHFEIDYRDASASQGESDRRNERGIREEKKTLVEREKTELNSYVEFSSREDKSSVTSGLPSSIPSLKSFSHPSLSSSLASPSFITSNSSNSIEEGAKHLRYSASGVYPNDLDINTCPEAPQFISSTPQEACMSLVSRKECLVLTANISQIVCQKCQIEDRMSIIRNSKLRFCSSYSAAVVTCASNTNTGNICQLRESPSVCSDYLQKIIDDDNKAEERYAGFLGLFKRYDCSSNYSVKWYCPHCKQAYKDWLCSQTIKFFRLDQIVPPCMEFCSHVEEMCPFFRPKLDSYAGDHSFICKDPHMNLPNLIPEDSCYGLCDLWRRSEISDFYCSHANLRGDNCPLLQRCDMPRHDKNSTLSNYSNINNSTSGSNSQFTVSRTPSSIILQTLLIVISSLLQLPLTLTESQHILKGFT